MPEFEKIPADQYVSLSSEGHFEINNETVKFWGVNLSQGACFPPKSKAPWIAARMRKMGFNLVRFHNLDNSWDGDEGSIFYENSATTSVLDFFALDRLHYFIAQLKAQGIYTNIELHSAREFRSGDGVLHPDSIWESGRGVNMFDRKIIELQKQYMLQLLTPVNQYTGMSLADDPAVAMMCISNSNTLYGYWKSDWLKHFSDGGILQKRHVDTLNLKWNNFIFEKYGDQNSLETTWNLNATTAGTNEQAKDGGFENANMAGDWIMELHDVAEAEITPDMDNPYMGNYSGRVDVTNPTSTNWHIQFKQVGATVEIGKNYEVKFAARAEDERDISLVLSRDNAPYNTYSFFTVPLTNEWQEFSFTFSPDEDNFENFRLGFQFNGQAGNYWFDEVSLTHAEVNGTLPGENIADGNISRIKYSERFNYTSERRRDMTEFYLKIQQDYFDEMYNYLRDELGVNAFISGSNSHSGISDIFTQKNMDFMDDQFTWDYVRFPNGWSPEDWYIPNEPMVKYPYWTMANGLFGGLMMDGKPMIVSEFRIPFPNNYAVELMPWMAAYGSFHDADAALFFEYNNSYDQWTGDNIEDFYSIHRHTGHMSISPLMAYAFRNQLISPANEKITLDYPEEYILNLPDIDNFDRWGKYLPYDQRRSFEHSIRVGSFSATEGPDLNSLPPQPSDEYASTNNGETDLNFTDGILKTVTPKFVSICGFLNENPIDAGALKINAGNDFGVVSWLSLSENNLSEADKSIFAVSSRIQNTGMEWVGTTTIQNDWGGSPTEMQPLYLNIELEINAPYIALYPLDEMGKEKEPKYFSPVSPDKFVLTLDQNEDKTVWYGIEALESVPTYDISENKKISVFPNPNNGQFSLNLTNIEMGESQLTFFNSLGQNVPLPTLSDCEGMSENCTYSFSAHHLECGIYYLKINLDGKIYTEKIIVE